jgi:ADP-L-glycero-D-manno-heptose 6-epimerase
MILVTGHKGFIGRNLVKHLTDRNQKVYGLDRKDGNVFDQLNSVPWKDITQIYHQGAISNTTETDVDKIYRHNIKFSVDLFEKAIQHEIVTKYASSASVYGNSNNHSYNPLNFYAMSKLTVDMWVKENRRRFKRNVTGFRYYNVYGNDEQKEDTAMSPVYKFSQQAKNTGTITVFEGSERMVRDFVCIDDVIDIIKDDHVNGIFDLGTGRPISFLKVAQLVAKKYDATIRYIPMPEILLDRYQFYTRAKEEYFHKFITVEDWLAKT